MKREENMHLDLKFVNHYNIFQKPNVIYIYVMLLLVVRQQKYRF